MSCCNKSIDYDKYVMISGLFIVFLFFFLSSACSAEGNLTISGKVFNDLNMDGEYDNYYNEPPLFDWTVRVSSSDGVQNEAKTAEDGSFIFKNLKKGKYNASQVIKPGWIQTYPPKGHYYTISENNTSINFGNRGDRYISGFLYIAADSNGKKDSGEAGSQGWTIELLGPEGYRDSVATTDGGRYTFSNLGPGTYIIKPRLPDDWLPAQPVSGQIKVMLKDDDNEVNINLGIRQVHNAKSDIEWWFVLLSVALPFIFIFSGLIALVIGLILLFKSPAGMPENWKSLLEKNAKEAAVIVLGLILILLGLNLLPNIVTLLGPFAPYAAPPSIGVPMWATLLVLLLIFAALIWIGVCQPGTMEQGQMRRAIAGILVFGFVVLLVFSLYGGIRADNKDIITQYIQLVGIIIGFYFGSRVVSETQRESTKEIEINSATFSKPPTLTVNLSNRSAGKITVDRIYVSDADGNVIGQATGLKREIASGENPAVSGELKDSSGKELQKDALQAGVTYTVSLEAPDGLQLAQSPIQIIPPVAPAKIPQEALKSTAEKLEIVSLNRTKDKKAKLQLKNTGANPVTLKKISIWDDGHEVIAKILEPVVTIGVNGVSEPIEVGTWPDDKTVGPQKEYTIKIETQSTPEIKLQSVITPKDE
ncbi:SdrD B-like domain protein [uncultured archaeon]|nr:SdrD B-like domain protein [uncultured archaeon]